MELTITHIDVRVQKPNGDPKFFAFNNIETEQGFINQYIALQELVSQVKLAEPAIKDDSRERYVLRKRPMISLNFISESDKESIVLEVETSKKKLSSLNGIATISSFDDEDDYEVSLGEFVEDCLNQKDIELDPFLSVTETPEGNVLFSAIVSDEGKR